MAKLDPSSRLTPALKRRITDDWKRLFPSLEILKPLQLLRRSGPLLNGITLDRNELNNLYIPAFYVHNLARSFPSISGTLKRRVANQYIQVNWHDSKHERIARRLREELPLPLDGVLRLGQVLNAYRQELARPAAIHPLYAYEDMLTLSVWVGDLEGAARIFAETEHESRQWPSEWLDEIGGRKKWLQHLSSLITDPSLVHTIAEQEAKRLKVDHLPDRGFVK